MKKERADIFRPLRFVLALAGIFGCALCGYAYDLPDYVYTYHTKEGAVFTDSVADIRTIDGKEYFIYQPELDNNAYWDEYFDSNVMWHNLYTPNWDLPSGRLLCKEGDRVFGYYEKQGEDSEVSDILTYDFGAEQGIYVDQRVTNCFYPYGTYWPGYWHYNSDAKILVIRDRYVELFGEPRHIQHVGILDNPAEKDASYYFCNPTGLSSFVQIEDMGIVTSPGTFAAPATYDYPTGELHQNAGCEIPYFSGVRTRDGKYSYTRLDLGVRSHNQLLDEMRVWEYYSETSQTESVHYMSFKGTMERDGQNYGVWGTDSVVSRDRTTGVITLLGGRDESAMWLMRENVGEIFVRGLDDDVPEVKVYDFMLQTGQEFPILSGGTPLTARIMPVTRLDITSARYETDGMVKTYSFEGMTDVLGITEYIGLWGDGTGHLASPAFMGGCMGYEEGNPRHPAPDCTLSRFMRICKTDYELPAYFEQCYESPIYADKVLPLLETAAASVRMTGTEPELTPKYYNLQGQPVAVPAKGDILIRVTGSRREKVIF